MYPNIRSTIMSNIFQYKDIIILNVRLVYLSYLFLSI